MREQGGWDGHAVFMTALAEEGFVVLGGPIGDGTRHRGRLIVKSSTEQEVRDRLAGGPLGADGSADAGIDRGWEVLLSKEPDS